MKSLVKAQLLLIVFLGSLFSACGEEHPARSGGDEDNLAGADGPATAEGDEGAAIFKDDPRFVAWADEVVEIRYGDSVGDDWRHPERALGKAAGDINDVVSLGEGGSITVGFDAMIGNGPGADFAVFENGFADGFLELAYVEVSSDGETFARFDCVYEGTEKVGSYERMDPENVAGLAGKFRVGYGTPFDLSALADHEAVASGQIDLQTIRFVRLLDVRGDGSMADSRGRPIYDPYPTYDSAGFDLDAVGALH